MLPGSTLVIRAWVNIYFTLFVAKLFLKNEEKKIKETAPCHGLNPNPLLSFSSSLCAAG